MSSKYDLALLRKMQSQHVAVVTVNPYGTNPLYEYDEILQGLEEGLEAMSQHARGGLPGATHQFELCTNFEDPLDYVPITEMTLGGTILFSSKGPTAYYTRHGRWVSDNGFRWLGGYGKHIGGAS